MVWNWVLTFAAGAVLSCLWTPCPSPCGGEPGYKNCCSVWSRCVLHHGYIKYISFLILSLLSSLVFVREPVSQHALCPAGQQLPRILVSGGFLYGTRQPRQRHLHCSFWKNFVSFLGKEIEVLFLNDFSFPLSTILHFLSPLLPKFISLPLLSSPSFPPLSLVFFLSFIPSFFRNKWTHTWKAASTLLVYSCVFTSSTATEFSCTKEVFPLWISECKNSNSRIAYLLFG